MQHMTSYVLTRRLFDPKKPGVILCGKDKLGQIFEVEQFLAKDVIFHLPKNLWAVPAQLVCAQEAIKRPATPNASDAEEGAAKRARTDAANPAKVTSTTARPPTPLVFHIPGSPAYDSGAESELSIQGHETDIVKDSTDDLWYLESNNEASDAEEGAAVVAAMAAHLSRLVGADDDCPFEVEYELESHSSVDGDAYSTDSDVVNYGPGDIVVCVEEDAGFVADSSDSSHSSDSEIGEEDLWECRLCETQNTPFHRYCQKCWKQRFGWLPDRQEKHPPQKRRRRQCRDKKGKRDAGKRHAGSAASSSSPPSSPSEGPSPPSSQAALDSQGLLVSARLLDFFTISGHQGPMSPLNSQPALQSQVTADASPTGEASSQELKDLLEAGPSSKSQEEPVSSQTVLRTPTEDPCAICMVRPKSGIIVHGRTSHCFGCYKCSRKLLKQNKRCPICRRHIDRVTQHFMD
ncbi:unnamed protein product [Ixodes hexagonus]